MANDTPEGNGQTATTTKKTDKVNYTYRNLQGEVQEKFDEEVTSVIAKVIADGGSVETKITDLGLTPEQVAAMPAMARMALVFGLKTTIGNALAPSVKMGWTPAQMVTELENRRNTIVVDKEWREGGGGGPRTSHIIEAFDQIALRTTGQGLSDLAKQTLKAKIKEVGSKPFTDDPAIAEELSALEVKRAQEKLEERRKAAQNAGPSALIQGFLNT